MSTDDKDLENFYRQQLTDLELKPSDNLWIKIEASLRPTISLLLSISIIGSTAWVYFATKKEVQLPFKTNRISATKSDSIPSLSETYKDYFPIGTAIYTGYLGDPERDAFITKQYASLTPEDQMKPLALQPQEGVFDFRAADKLVDFATQHRLKVRGHCLVWFHRMPNWFYKDGNKLAQKKLILKRLKDHISKVAKRYKGKVYCWDVVNEAVTWRRGEFFKSEDTLYQILGEEYITKSFQYAHEADPDAKLFYNEIWFNDPEKSKQLFQFIKKLKSKGVPIDGIGMQCHLTILGTSETRLQETIDKYHSIGVEFQITELDISIYQKSDPASVKYEKEEYSEEIQIKQAELFEMIFRVCRKNKEKVTGITLWAPSDGNNYLSKWLKKGNYPYLFDRDLKPKKAFYRVVEF